MKKLLLAILFTILTGYAWANVPNATPLYNQYSCNSSTTQWPYAFQITAPSDMQVFVNNNTGMITQEPINTFSVDQTNVWVNYPLTGPACPTGSTITIQASTPQTQTTTYSQRTPFTATAVGASFDKLTLISQQLQGQLNRAILAPAGTSTFTFPPSVPNTLLGWDPSGSGNIVNYTPNTGAYLTQATTGDAQTGTNNTKYMTPYLVGIEVGYSGAVSIPYANLTGTASSGANSNITSLTGLSTPLTTGQGGTGSNVAANGAGGVVVPTGAVNAASGAVVLNGSSQLPAVSGALLTNLPAQIPFSTQNVVTGSRSIGTVYRNTTGKTMYVSVVGSNATMNAVMAFITDSSSSPSTAVSNIQSYSSGGVDLTVSGMVLNNNYYEVTIGGSSPTLSSWTEWD